MIEHRRSEVNGCNGATAPAPRVCFYLLADPDKPIPIAGLNECLVTMASGEDAYRPRYSFPATRRRALRLDRAVRIKFYDDAILIYRRHFNFRRDSDYSLLCRVKYSAVRRCEYLGPRVESGSTFTGFVWAEMPAEIGLSIPGSDAGPARQGGDPSWKLEQLCFSGNDMTEREFKGIYAWLRAKLELEQRNA